MTRITRFSIDDLVASGSRYVADRARRADANQDGSLSATEAAQLAHDLQDDFAGSDFKTSRGSVAVSNFVREFEVNLRAWATEVDHNADGFITRTDAKRLPQHLRDNVANYIAAQEARPQPSPIEVDGVTTKNLTTAGRVAEHLEAYGESLISYEDAFARALKVAATDPDGLVYLAREYGGPNGAPLGESEAKAEVKKWLAHGSMALVEVNADLPTGEDTRDAWIFQIDVNGNAGDHGVWAVIDRTTGESYVTTFN